MKNIVVLTGAGMSAQSGISTFRDSGGLWENYPVHQVASIEGWHTNPELMLAFYNQRRTALKDAQPNKGHLILAGLEKHFHVRIITHIGYDPIAWGDKATDGSQLRPYVVWFGEPVPNMTKAIQWTQEADVMIVAGTSLVVYPTAGLVDFAQESIPLFLVDPKPAPVRRNNLYVIADKAVEGLEKIHKILIENYL